MADKLDTYYTMRMTQEKPFTKVEVSKWEEFADEPKDTYEVFPDGRPGAGMCSCPAYKVCKHTRAVQEAIRDGSIHEAYLHQWYETKDRRLVRKDS